MGLGVFGLVVLIFLFAFVWRLLNPPVSPYVESGEQHSVIQMDIVNASNVNGGARTTMRFLRDRGFDVVDLSTQTPPVVSSMIIDRLGDRQSALKVAHVLGIADSLVVSSIDTMLFVNVTVLLGKDLYNLTPFQ
ncbi:MAG: hypothetical protein AMXMBFR68_01920 [Ignavibacteria bacterium]